MANSGQLIIVGAIAVAIVIVALAIAENIQQANALEVITPYSTIRTARIKELRQ